MGLFLDRLESSLEFINSTADIDELLLAGEEGVTLRADLDLDLVSASGVSGPGCDGLAAGAADHYLFVFGMDAFLHDCLTFLCAGF